MSANWRALSRKAGIRFDGEALRIACGPDRDQKVWVDDSSAGVLRVWSQVATRKQLRNWEPESGAAEVEAWLINRYRELVGFKHVDRGLLIGEAWVPDIEISADEWRMYVDTVAKACDRLEFLWTGGDEF